MINKRLLIKNLLAHNDENSFYDKKRKIDISHKEGKAKFLKHICALSNSNPANNSYIVIGVEDEDNRIIGVDFFDDSKIQNLINAYLENPPIVQYENIPFPHLPDDKVVGLVTVRAKSQSSITALKRNIWKYYGGSVFLRKGSMSLPRTFGIEIKDVNSKIVKAIEGHARNSIRHTLDGVFDFMRKRRDFNPRYEIFREYFVVCWAGQKKVVGNEVFYSRVDIELINEQVRLFYSALDEVSIEFTDDNFKIIEYVNLGLQSQDKYFTLEETVISFDPNANYNIESTLIFDPPQYDKSILHHVFNANNAILKKLKSGLTLREDEEQDLRNLPVTYLICHFNGFDEALDKLKEAKSMLRKHSPTVWSSYKEAARVLRKVKYN